MHDDAVSSESEHAVKEALERLMHGKTVVIVAHRLSTVRAADVVFVISGGTVVGQGTHDELLSSSALYAKLVQRQLLSAAAMTKELLPAKSSVATSLNGTSASAGAEGNDNNEDEDGGDDFSKSGTPPGAGVGFGGSVVTLWDRTRQRDSDSVQQLLATDEFVSVAIVDDVNVASKESRLRNAFSAVEANESALDEDAQLLARV